MIPTVGRIVHYTNLGDADGKYPPEQQAAIDDIATHDQGIATSLGAIDTEVNPPAPTP